MGDLPAAVDVAVVSAADADADADLGVAAAAAAAAVSAGVISAHHVRTAAAAGAVAGDCRLSRALWAERAPTGRRP